MKATNIGIVKAIVSKKLSNDFLLEGKFDNSKKIAKDFLDIVKESPLLQLEFKVYDRLENKTITNDISATRYIDNNLNLFEEYKKEDFDKEHQKLKDFVDENVAFIPNDKYELYVAINNLIYESTNKKNPDVDIIHESFTTVLNYVKKEKEIIKEEEKLNLPEGIDSEKLIEIALNKFSVRYNSLDESDIKLIKELVLSDSNNKKNIFESLKIENVSKLENTDKKGIEDKIHETIDKIKKMEYSEKESIKNIMSLHELKKNLI